ncbi:MAG: hypothetical protein ABIT70_09015 [Sulfuriferula sp.]
MTILSKEQILSADDLPRETVAVPEWGGDVIVQAMSAVVSEEVFNAAKGDNVNFAIIMLANSLVDESGKLLFAVDDIASLKTKNSKVVTGLVKVCNRLNFFDEAAVEKNLPPASSGISA